MRRTLVIALSVILALAMAVPAAYAQSGQGSATSKDIGQLSAQWWLWALQNPTATSPLVGNYKGGEQCDGEFVDGVFFLAGSTKGQPVSRSCTVPSDTAIFFPTVTIACSENLGDTRKDISDAGGLINYCEGLFEQFTEGGEMFATLDGQDVPIVCETSPLFKVTVLEDNPFGFPEATRPKQAVAVGCYALIPALEPGEYTLTFGISGSPFEQDITYRLTVV